MSVQSYLRFYWSGNSQNYAVQAASASADTFTFSGNKEREFLSGTPFTVSGTASNDGGYTSTGATYSRTSNQTTVTVAAVPANQGVSGNAVISKFVEFEWFEGWQVKFNNPAMKDADRYGIVHRLMPVASAAVKRYAINAVLNLEKLELDRRTTTGNTFYEDLYTLAVDGDTQFIIFQYEVGSRDGSEFTIKRYYLGYIDDVDGLQDMLSGLGEIGSVSIPFVITADGTFSTFGDKTSVTGRTRP